MEPGEFRRQLRLLMADRTTPEAAAMFQVLIRYVHKRVVRVCARCGGRIAPSRQEELVADVMLQLMDGGLVRFRGGSLPELLGFVRTIADRGTWRAVRGLERERAALAGADLDTVRHWTAIPPRPDEMELLADTPLSEGDQVYLIQLLRAGSKAELARRAGVSRAAVTQRVQRIRARIGALAEQDRMAHQVWMTRSARSVLAEEDMHSEQH
jgi:DNA-directed RNA polymerase specialized sigma24 family protein